jgi:hypothetical protein
MIDAAIDHLRQSESTQWLVFYLMMRAEIARQTNESPVGLRKWIRDLDTDMYEMFMAVEGATQRTKRLDGIKEVTIVEPPVVLTESYLVTDGWRTWVVGHDLACRALGIDDDDISAKQREFLGRTTLKDLLESHGVPLSF